MEGFQFSIVAIISFLLATMIFRRIWISISGGTSETEVTKAASTFTSIVFYGLMGILVVFTLWFS
jgi:hypothetical protein